MNFRKKGRPRRTSTSVLMEGASKWRPTGMRMSRSNSDDDSDEDVEMRKKEITDWADEFFGRRSLGADSADQQDVEFRLTKKQTLVLSTLVPDEILLLDKFETGEPRRFVGVLMMADVSGYTALSERYNNTGKAGTYRLTVTLNTYLGALIEIIYSHGGDIIKFAGDAFLALWKTDKKSFLSHTIHSVIACALVIQHSYAKYETDVKVNLRVKLAISAGNLMFSPIGTGIDMNYVIFGLPVMEAKLAESKCASGEVQLAPSAWAHMYSRNYDHTVHEDGHVTITAILYDPREKEVNKPFLGFSSLLRQVKKNNHAVENLPESIWDCAINLSSSELLLKNEVLSLRKAILKCENKDLGSKLRNFMIRPVLTQVDAHQPLEYLTEMRQVSILFVTLKPRQCPPAQFITIVNNSYQLTCQIVYKSMGCVNKIILFDKDVMILVIFGLRGFKHESEAQVALKCAYSIRKSVSALDGVQEISIGVTTGQVYCGVVGHSLRREFTVIGAIVNKAARLMCSFRNKISCDEATFIKSKMSKNGFTLQPQIELKGIDAVGKIYEYTEEIRVKEFKNIPIIPPLLDRSDETQYFESWLEQAELPNRNSDGLLLMGESRIGKSRMLEWLARIAQHKGHNVCFLNLTSIHSANAYLALSQIVDQMLGLNSSEPDDGFMKEQKIVDLLKVYDEDLCYLNNIIKVRFAYNEGVFTKNENKRKEKAKTMFDKLLDSLSETYVILLDDLRNLDPFSWEYISMMLPKLKIFTVLAVTRGKFSNVHTWIYNIFINETIKKIILGPLTFEWIPPLACQILDVDAVPNDLCNALKAHCKGMPGFVESLIVHLFSSGAIEIKKVTDEKLEDWKVEDLQFPDPDLLKPLAFDIKNQDELNKLREEEATGEIAICVVTNKEELTANFNDHNVDTIIMIQIDTLTPYQQLLLKISSVIGNTISRDLLENIMYENDPLITARAIKRLFAMKIFSCATTKYKKFQKKYMLCSAYSSPFTNGLRRDKLVCDCDFEYDPDNSNGLPKYSFCKVMRFRNKNSRKICYELLPMNQKKEFHLRIVHYLERNDQKCPDCGGNLNAFTRVLMLEDETPEQSSQFERRKHNPASETSSCYLISPSAKNTKTSRSESSWKSQPNVNISSPTDNNNTNHSRSLSNTTSSISDKAKYSEIEDDLTNLNCRRFTQRITVSSLLFKEKNGNCESYADENVLGMLRSITEANSLDDWHRVGIIDSQDEIDGDREAFSSYAVPIEKGVSKTNLKKCTCVELNILIYKQLIHHAQQAELKQKAVEFMLHFCYLCLLADNGEPILDKLEEAEFFFLEKSNQKIIIRKSDLKKFMARIYSLKACYALKNGELSNARTEVEKAIRIYELPVTKGSDFFFLYKLRNYCKRRHNLEQEKLLRSDSVFCLNVAALLYAAEGDEKTARTCAQYAITVAQKWECRVTDLCDVFTCALQLEIDRGCPECTMEIEKVCKHVLRRISHPVRVDELYALGKLFLASFRARLARAEIHKAIRSGYRAIVIRNFLQAFHVSVNLIPDLFYALLCRRRIEEAIEIVKLCLQLSKNKQTQECEMWYYALCMDLILDGGFQLESPSEINRYCEFALHRKAEGPARRRLVINLWTYWLRMNAERKAKNLENEVFYWLANNDNDGSLTSLLSALRLAEGLLESLAKKMDDLRKVVDLMELRSTADRELNSLESDCKLMRIVYCRWTRLKGNSLGLSGRKSTSMAFINQALEEGKRIHNSLEESITRAALSNSHLWIDNAHSGNFMSWQDAARQTRELWHHNLYKITTSRR